MARRSEHTLEQIREMILQAAESIVEEQGLAGLTVRKIALDIGYTVGSIYMVFANMNDLIMHLKARVLEQLAEQLNQRIDDQAVEQLKFLALAYYGFAKANYNLWRELFVAVDHKPLPAWYVEKIGLMLAPIEAACRQLYPDLDEDRVTQMARTLWGSLHGLCQLWLNGGFGSLERDAAVDSLNLLIDRFVADPRGG